MIWKQPFKRGAVKLAGTTINDKILSSLKALSTDKSTSTNLKNSIDLQTMDWMQLLVAQLKNQDMYNQTDNAQMMSQMAQYSQIQAVQSMVDMQEDLYAMNSTSYAASLLGQTVTTASVETIATSAGTVDKLTTTTGVVTGVTLFEGAPIIYVDGKPFSLSQIMVVGEVPNGMNLGGDEDDSTKNPGDEGDDGTKTPGVDGDEGTKTPGDDGGEDTKTPGADDGE